MTFIIYKILAGIIIFITSLVGVIYPLKARAHPAHHQLLELGDAFASGIFLGAALFHMLPDATSAFAESYSTIHYPLAQLICASGFLLLLFFERLSGTRKHRMITLSYVIAVIIIIHSLIEGMALGINTTLATASIIFVAILAHKSSESFALAITLNQSQLSLRHIIFLIVVFAMMTPLGIGVGTMLTEFSFAKSHLIAASINAFAAGTFLYMSTLHHINHHQRSHEREGLVEFFSLVVGLVIMAGLAVWA